MIDLKQIERNVKEAMFQEFLKEAFKDVMNVMKFNEMDIYEKLILEAYIKNDKKMFKAYVFDELEFRRIDFNNSIVSWDFKKTKT